MKRVHAEATLRHAEIRFNIYKSLDAKNRPNLKRRVMIFTHIYLCNADIDSLKLQHAKYEGRNLKFYGDRNPDTFY